MFARVKKTGSYQYLQIVHNERVDGKVQQRVIATLGRLDLLQSTGELDNLIESCARFAQHTAVINAVRKGDITPAHSIRIGPALVFERLWNDLGFPKIFQELLQKRRFEFSIERAVFLTVMHRLFASGSDRAGEYWKQSYAITGADDLDLHQMYRAMGYLGDELHKEQQTDATPFVPRCNKDLIEEALFQKRRDLFTGLDLVFFDTTSIYFEGQGGVKVGQHGYSKDHRPDLKQMVVGVVLDATGRPICCELWPGNTTDVTTLIPIVDRLRSRFAIGSVCVVADRGMISAATIEKLKERSIHFILGARLRNVREIRQKVLSHTGRYHEVNGPRKQSKDPSPLKVKDVSIGERRYVVCHNEEQAKKDKADREAIVQALREQLKQSSKSLVGNKGYRKYLKATRAGVFEIDDSKIKSEARFDGKWVLQTDTELPGADVALKYKDLLLVECVFRNMKSILETRPIYHKRDETIRGHVFCSFLAIVLLKELMGRLESSGHTVEWQRLRDDLEDLQEVTVHTETKSFVIRTAAKGDVSKALQAAGVALGRVVRCEDGPSSSP
jgi:Transposase DDE domain